MRSQDLLELIAIIIISIPIIILFIVIFTRQSLAKLYTVSDR